MHYVMSLYILRFEIPFGTYSVSEFYAPDGYILDTTPISVTIKEDRQVVSIVMKNTPTDKPPIPPTGNNSSFWDWFRNFVICLGVTTAISLIVCLSISSGKKHKKSDSIIGQ